MEEKERWRRQRRQAGEWDGWTERRMRNSEVRSETAGEMGGGVSFPLLNYCSVYLGSTFNHCRPAEREGNTHTHKHTHTHTQTHTNNTQTHTLGQEPYLLLFRTFHLVIFFPSSWLWGWKGIHVKCTHTHTHAHTQTHTHTCKYPYTCKLLKIQVKFSLDPLTFWFSLNQNIRCKGGSDQGPD